MAVEVEVEVTEDPAGGEGLWAGLDIPPRLVTPLGCLLSRADGAVGGTALAPSPSPSAGPGVVTRGGGDGRWSHGLAPHAHHKHTPAPTLPGEL